MTQGLKLTGQSDAGPTYVLCPDHGLALTLSWSYLVLLSILVLMTKELKSGEATSVLVMDKEVRNKAGTGVEVHLDTSLHALLS